MRGIVIVITNSRKEFVAWVRKDITNLFSLGINHTITLVFLVQNTIHPFELSFQIHPMVILMIIVETMRIVRSLVILIAIVKEYAPEKNVILHSIADLEWGRK